MIGCEPRRIFQEGEAHKQPEDVQPGDGYECLGLCKNSTITDVHIEIMCHEGKKPGDAVWMEKGKTITTEDIIIRAEEVKEDCEPKCTDLPDSFSWECFLNETEIPGGRVGPGVECRGQCKNLVGTNATTAITVQCKLDENGEARWHNKTEVISDEEITVQAKLCPCHDLPDVFAWQCFTEDGDVQLTKEQIKEPARDGRKCKGYCFEKNARNTSALIEIDCVLQGNIPNWETPNGVVVTIDEIKLSAERANETECQIACPPLPDSLFEWNCTLKVIEISIHLLCCMNIFRKAML